MYRISVLLFICVEFCLPIDSRIHSCIFRYKTYIEQITDDSTFWPSVSPLS